MRSIINRMLSWSLISVLLAVGCAGPQGRNATKLTYADKLDLVLESPLEAIRLSQYQPTPTETVSQKIGHLQMEIARLSPDHATLPVRITQEAAKMEIKGWGGRRFGTLKNPAPVRDALRYFCIHNGLKCRFMKDAVGIDIGKNGPAFPVDPFPEPPLRYVDDLNATVLQWYKCLQGSLADAIEYMRITWERETVKPFPVARLVRDGKGSSRYQFDPERACFPKIDALGAVIFFQDLYHVRASFEADQVVFTTVEPMEFNSYYGYLNEPIRKRLNLGDNSTADDVRKALINHGFDVDRDDFWIWYRDSSIVMRGKTKELEAVREFLEGEKLISLPALLQED